MDRFHILLLVFLVSLYSNTLATWCGELTHLKRPWCWERLGAGGEGDDRGWDGWMASLTHGFGWTPGVSDGQGGLACCGSWGHKESDTTEWLNWTDSLYQTDSFLLLSSYLMLLLSSFKSVICFPAYMCLYIFYIDKFFKCQDKFFKCPKNHLGGLWWKWKYKQHF